MTTSTSMNSDQIDSSSGSDSDYLPQASPPAKTRPPTTKTKTHTPQKLKLSSLVTAATLPAPGNLEHKRQKFYGKKMSILTINGQKYMIGVQIASLLQRETYNLYRSMKVKKITVLRASPEQVDYLLKTNVVKPGTRSITFIPIDQGMSYINEEIKKVGLRKKTTENKSPKPYTVERSKLSKPQTPPPMIVAELEMEQELESEESSQEEESAFEVLCAAAEDEYNTQANKLKGSTSSLSTMPMAMPVSTLTPPSMVFTMPISGSGLPTTTIPNFRDFFPFLLPSLYGIGAHDNAVYKPFGESLPQGSGENPARRAVVGR